MRTLAFGQICLKLEGEAELPDPLPPDWPEAFGQACRQTARMRLERADGETDGPLSEGWNPKAGPDRQTAVFVRRGKPVFGLSRAFPPEPVTVRAWQTDSRSLRMGVQYGLMLALSGSCVGLHGVTLRCGGETVILSAPSGTGKTTLAGFLTDTGYARVINGDFALLSVTEEGVVFEPTPFCGTSGVCRQERLRVDRIVFLAQSAEDTWRDLSPREAMAQLMSNAFVPVWDPGLQQELQRNMLQVLEQTTPRLFSFANHPAAAEAFLSRFPAEALRKEAQETKPPKPADIMDLDWICPFCGAPVKCRRMQDAARHMTVCRANPYRLDGPDRPSIQPDRGAG